MNYFFSFFFAISSLYATAGDSLQIVNKKVNFGFAVNNNRIVNSIIVHSAFSTFLYHLTKVVGDSGWLFLGFVRGGEGGG